MKEAYSHDVRGGGKRYVVAITSNAEDRHDDDYVSISEFHDASPTGLVPREPRSLNICGDIRLKKQEVAELRDALTQWLETGELK